MDITSIRRTEILKVIENIVHEKGYISIVELMSLHIDTSDNQLIKEKKIT